MKKAVALAMKEVALLCAWVMREDSDGAASEGKFIPLKENK